ncbi:MAG: M23 family metallopeptidase [Oscillospiraceae bacterium]|nr:M23 family metallopeptidase [Candidatus Equicaccousia limihippi]
MAKENKFMNFLNGKGFYAAVGACVLAIGITAWVAFDSLPKPATVKKSVTSSQTASLAPAAGVQSGVKASSEPKTEETSSKEDKQPAATFFVLPLTGEIIKPYSDSELQYSKTYDDFRAHKGIDIAADKGAVVKTCGEGTVRDVKKDSLRGNTVIIDHGNGIAVHYCGLADKTAVKVGDTVKSGDTIGAVGEIPEESGDVSHLHLEFYENGVAVSPLSLIKLGEKNE